MNEWTYPSDETLEYGDGRIEKIAYRGLTKREWFAGLAMQAMLNSEIRREEMATVSNIARDCFQMADAMIAEGGKQ